MRWAPDPAGAAKPPLPQGPATGKAVASRPSRLWRDSPRDPRTNGAHNARPTPTWLRTFSLRPLIFRKSVSGDASDHSVRVRVIPPPPYLTSIIIQGPVFVNREFLIFLNLFAWRAFICFSEYLYYITDMFFMQANHIKFLKNIFCRLYQIF